MPDPADRPGVMRLDALAELARQLTAAGDRQAPLRRRLGGRQVEHVLLDAGDIEPPGNHAGAARRRGKGGDAIAPDR